MARSKPAQTNKPGLLTAIMSLFMAMVPPAPEEVVAYQSRRAEQADRRASFASDTHAASSPQKLGVAIMVLIVTYVLAVLVVTQINSSNVDELIECEADPGNHTVAECDALQDAQDSIFLALTLGGVATGIAVVFIVIKMAQD